MNSSLEAAATPAANTYDAVKPEPAWPAILMVDDHPARLLTYEAILNGMPVRFVRANSGEEALQLLLKQSFALILLDVNMPGIDGFEVARHVRGLARLEKTPIIFVSGERLTDLDRLKGYEVGAIDYISVPIVPEILRSKVAVLVELFNRRIELERLNASRAESTAATESIAARRIADHALQESRQRLQLAHDSAGLGSFDWNVQLDTATWDTRARELWGIGPEMPMNLAAALAGIHPDDRRDVVAAIDRALRGEQDGRYRAAYRVINVRDGKTRWVESHGQVIFENGSAMRMVGTKRDITERVAAEDALRESEERFRELANNIDQMVWTCDAAGQPTWFNDRWYEFSGTTFEQMLDGRWSSLVHPDHATRIVERFRDCVAAGEVWEEIFPVRSKTGEYRWFLSRAIPIKAGDGTVQRWFGSNTDITAHRRLQEALSEADQRKDEFLAMLAHELRNPVAPILSAAQILSRQGPDTSDLPGMVSIIQRQATHLARLLDDLLDVARITRGRIDLRREVVPLADCVALATETVDPLVRASRHELVLDQSRRDLFVDVDKARVTQCLTNLLDNAAKYSPPGSRIELKTFAQDGQAVIEVRDTGRGIAAHLLPRIFELFAQGDRTLDRRSGGLGIGLSVCKRLLEMHGGGISAHSEGEGRGATFRMVLPLAQRVADEAPDVSTTPEPRRKRVLIVDDNQDAADTISMLLEMDGHETKVVLHGRDALDAWPAFAADVAILDIGLPDLSGYDVVAGLRKSGFRGLAIALSGYGQPEDKRRALESGFDMHLVKPVDVQALEMAISESAAP